MIALLLVMCSKEGWSFRCWGRWAAQQRFWGESPSSCSMVHGGSSNRHSWVSTLHGSRWWKRHFPAAAAAPLWELQVILILGCIFSLTLSGHVSPSVVPAISDSDLLSISTVLHLNMYFFFSFFWGLDMYTLLMQWSVDVSQNTCNLRPRDATMILYTLKC